MITIKVCRGSAYPGECREDDPNLNWGEDISDALLESEEAARERGKVEIDENYSNRKNVNITTYETNFIQPGTLVGISDKNLQKNGRLNSITINIARSVNSLTANSSISIERAV